jgi:hypothetical protein
MAEGGDTIHVERARWIVDVTGKRSSHDQYPMLLDQWEQKVNGDKTKKKKMLWNHFLVRSGCNQFCIALITPSVPGLRAYLENLGVQVYLSLALIFVSNS